MSQSNFERLHVGDIVECIGGDFVSMRQGDTLEVIHKDERLVFLVNKSVEGERVLRLSHRFINNANYLVLRSVAIFRPPLFGFHQAGVVEQLS